MIAKRIRCECGRVYEPAKHETCPACGARTAGTEVPRKESVDGDDAVVSPNESKVAPSNLPTRPRAIGARTIAIIAGGVLVAAVLGFFVLRPKPQEQNRGAVTAEPSVSPVASASPSPSAGSGAPTVVVIPPSGGSPTSIVPQAFDLAATLASAPAGATIKVPAGVYPGGLIVARAVRIVGTGGQVFIQSDGRECLSVRAPGVAVQNVQFICNGIGELPAISVADGGELELDGCKVQSSTALGVSVTGNTSIKAVGSSFASASGTALRVNQQARGNFTQCAFSDSRFGLMALAGANLELRSCAFERDGGNDSLGAALAISGANTNAVAEDCYFTGNLAGISVNDRAALTLTNSSFKDNGPSSGRGVGSSALLFVRNARASFKGNNVTGNRQGLLAMEGGALEIEKCTFSQNGLQQSQQIVMGSLPLIVTGQGSSASVRSSIFSDSFPYAMTIMSGGRLTLEETEVTGTQYIGVLVGDRNGPPAHADVKRSRFLRNGSGVGVYGGSSASVEESECRENKDGLLALDSGSRLTVTKSGIFNNREHGLHAYSNAEVSAVDCEFRDNARGAQSGNPRRSAQRASLTLQDCRLGGNKIFGAGAYAKSDLILTRCTFDGTDKANIYKERGSNVQADPVAAASPSPDPSGSPADEAEEETSASPTPRKPRPTPRPRVRRPEDDAARILRRIFGPPR